MCESHSNHAYDAFGRPQSLSGAPAACKRRNLESHGVCSSDPTSKQGKSWVHAQNQSLANHMLWQSALSRRSLSLQCGPSSNQDGPAACCAFGPLLAVENIHAMQCEVSKGTLPAQLLVVEDRRIDPEHVCFIYLKPGQISQLLSGLLHQFRHVHQLQAEVAWIKLQTIQCACCAML